jgi:hypothetical protein
MTQNINDFMGNANIKTQKQGIINNFIFKKVKYSHLWQPKFNYWLLHGAEFRLRS